MSTNEIPARPKRKISEDGIDKDDIIESLRRHKKRELSPESSKQAETLLDTATKSRDNPLLQSAFDFFEAKQKQKEEAKSKSTALVNKIQDLEAQLQQAKAQLDQMQANERQAQAEQSYFRFLLEYGDWFQFMLGAMRGPESKIAGEDISALKAQFNAAYNIHYDQALAASENGLPSGIPAEQRDILGQEKKNIQNRARDAAKWDCLNGPRHTTSSQDIINAERQSVLEWRENGQNASDAPGTPFLDRIQRMCVKAGITRLQCLDWIQKYAERNLACHKPPPKVSHYWIKNVAGEEITVDRPENAHTVIDWAAMKADVDSLKNDIEAKHASGHLNDERKVYILELIDQFWKFHSEGTDAAGNPVITDFAQKQAEEYAKRRDNVKPLPPQDYLKSYQEGKWDDLL
ncbi:hypothetical protein IL306_014884 [Fusarium sp. DS 682]|nr:hypothetical protein IL306_014884 [Fusarium sp. DS 682]